MQKEITKVALITGSARRIGAEIAKIFHKAGMNVVLHYHTSQTAAETLCATLNKKRKHSAIVVRADLQEVASIESLAVSAFKAWGRLDILVNNASRFYKTEIGKTTEFSWDDLINSNLKAPFFLSQACTKYLKKSEGIIINIGDIHGKRPMRDYGVYCISKAGIMMLTKTLAKELGPKVRVNAIAPGNIVWPEGDNQLQEQTKDKILSKIVLRRLGNPEEIAKTALFLAIDGEFITGQIIAVDGGRSLQI